MGNSESSCYEFRKDKKVKEKYEISDNREKKGSEIAASFINADKVKSFSSPSRVLETKANSRADEDSFTPIQPNHKYRNISCLNDLDPRSPTEGIKRTPLHLSENNLDLIALDDPRSPTVGIDRTPIIQENFVEDKTVCIANDTPSPSIKYNETPLNLANNAANLRRTVLMTNTLKSSPLNKKIIYSPDSSVKNVNSPLSKKEIEFKSNHCSESFVDKGPSSEYDTAFCQNKISHSVSDTFLQSSVLEDFAQANTKNSSKWSKNTSEPELPVSDKTVVGKHIEDIKSLDKVEDCKDALDLNSKSVEVNPTVLKVEPVPSNEIMHYAEKPDSATQAVNQNVNNTPSNILTTKNKSLIPVNLVNTERKVKVKTSNKRHSSNQSENKSALVQKKEKRFKQLQQPSVRSPLALLSHNNSPEPKRLRVTINKMNSGDSSSKSSTSRLPRYTSRSNSSSRS